MPSQRNVSYCGEVRFADGAPRLVINGRIVPPVIYGLSDIPASGTETPQAQKNIAAFAKRGIGIVQIDCELHLCWLPGGVCDANHVRQEIAHALEANPDEAIMIRLHMNPPVWWMRENPQEMTGYFDGPAEDEGMVDRLIGRDLDRMLRVSLASEKFLKEGSEILSHLCQQLAETNEGRHVIGIQIACGVYGEWLYWGMFHHDADSGPAMRKRLQKYLRKKYGSDAALQAAWQDPDVTFETVSIPGPDARNHGDDGLFRDPRKSCAVIDALKCQQTSIPDAIHAFAAVIRKVWPRPIILGAFYGYYFNLGTRSAIGGHLESTQLLNDPYVDFLAGPFCYYPANRASGNPGLSRGLVESVRLHHKLWFTEMDQAPLGTAEFPGGGDPAQYPESTGLFLRNMLEILSRGMGAWYYDHRVIPVDGSQTAKWGSIYEKIGWWEADYWMDQIEKIQHFMEKRADKPYRSPADVAMIFDTEEMYHVALSHTQNLHFDTIPSMNAIRAARIGAAINYVNLQDLDRVDWSQYKTVIFASTLLLTEEQKRIIHEKIKNSGRHLVWFYAPGYSDGKSLSDGHVAEITGLPVRKAATPEGGEAMAPFFAPEYGEKKFADWSSHYFASDCLDVEKLRKICRDAGSHIYTTDFEDVIAGNGFVAVHTAHGGKGTLFFRNGKSLTVDLPPCSTTLFETENAEA